MTDTTTVQPASPQGKPETVALTQGRGGILGVKAGMTQIFDDAGNCLAVTVIDLKSAPVITQVKTREKEGYQAIQVGFINKKARSATKSESGALKARGLSQAGFHHYQEFRLEDGHKLEGLTIGKALTAEFIKAGDFIDLQSTSKGKGVQGGMKRFHMGGNYKTHGASLSHRSLGSIGNRADPGKCFKNVKMPGHMGHEIVTIQNVKVIRVDLENQLLLVNGSVPGPRSGIVTIRKSGKRAKKVG